MLNKLSPKKSYLPAFLRDLKKSYCALSSIDKFDVTTVKDIKTGLSGLLERTQSFVSEYTDVHKIAAKTMKSDCKIFIKNFGEHIDDEKTKTILNDIQVLWNEVLPDSKFEWTLYKITFGDENEKQYICVTENINAFDNKWPHIVACVENNTNVLSGTSKRRKIDIINHTEIPLMTYKSQLEHLWNHFEENSIITSRSCLSKLAKTIQDSNCKYQFKVTKENGLYIFEADDRSLDIKNEGISAKSFQDEYIVPQTQFYGFCAHRLEDNLETFVYYTSEIDAFEKIEGEPVPVKLQKWQLKNDTDDREIKLREIILSEENAFKITIECKLTNVKTVAVHFGENPDYEIFAAKEIAQQIEPKVNTILSKIDSTLNWVIGELKAKDAVLETPCILLNDNGKLLLTNEIYSGGSQKGINKSLISVYLQFDDTHHSRIYGQNYSGRAPQNVFV